MAVIGGYYQKMDAEEYRYKLKSCRRYHPETMFVDDEWERIAGIDYHGEGDSGKPILYFDMDGVLAKWQTEKEDGTPIIFDEDILPAYKHYYRTLPPHEDMCRIVNELSKRNDLEVRVLSKSVCSAIQDKLLWLNDHIPNLPIENVILVPYTEVADKSNFVPRLDERTILFDDYTPNQKDFNNKDGVAVNVMNGVNRADCIFPNFVLEGVDAKKSIPDRSLNYDLFTDFYELLDYLLLDRPERDYGKAPEKKTERTECHGRLEEPLAEDEFSR